jgi:hypothetical protein
MRFDVALGVIVGFWFMVMGTYGLVTAARSPESPAGHWASHPAGRRMGGVLTWLVGLAIVLGSLTLL